MPKLLRIFMVLTLVSFSFVFAVSSATAAPGVTLTVNTTADGPDVNPGDGLCEANVGVGDCTLRAAIEETNANTNPTDTDVINFAIPGAGIHTISPTTDFPHVTEPLSIDATSQGGTNCAAHQLAIEVDGQNTNVAQLNFDSTAPGSTVKGLSIVNSTGLAMLIEANSFTAQCNNIGVRADGSTIGANELTGIRVNGTNNILIGGANPADGNIVSRSINSDGIWFSGTSNTVTISSNNLSFNKNHGVSFTHLVNATISNNTVTNNLYDGIAGDLVDNVVVNNNTVSNQVFSGISFLNAHDSTVSNNTVDGNGEHGILVGPGNNNSIADNTVTNNAITGIILRSDNSSVNNNRIVSNGGGMSIENNTNSIIRDNVVGNGTNVGILMTSTVNNVIAGNFIGVDDDGQTVLPNGNAGIVIMGGPTPTTGNIVGGTTPADRNVIANGSRAHVVIFGTGGVVSQNRIIGNYLGVDGTGAINPSFVNGSEGVIVAGNATGNTIGGFAPGESNIIANNTTGISMLGISAFSLVPQDNSVLANSIYSNFAGATPGFGIDLNDDSDGNMLADASVGVTVNDAGDSDSGPNNYLNFPIVSNVATTDDDVSITYGLDANLAQHSATGFRIQFYANIVTNPSGHGDGQIFIGYEDISGPVSNHTFTIANTGLPVGTYSFALTATAITSSPTGFGATSEFSGVEVAGISATQDIVTTTTTTTAPSVTGNVSGNSNSKSASGVLSTTGADSTPIALNAFVIILVGAAIVFAAKRKRTRHSI